jgi:xylitol oxidase
LRRVKALRDTIGPLLQVSEIRTIAADDLWLSGSYGRDSVGIHFTWHNDSAIFGVLPVLEAALIGLGARPHWGKLFTMAPTHITKMYPMFSAFTEMVRHWDPTGKFTNSLLGAILK